MTRMPVTGQGARQRRTTHPTDVSHGQGLTQPHVIRKNVFHTSPMLTSETHVSYSQEAVKHDEAPNVGRIRPDKHRGSEGRT